VRLTNLDYCEKLQLLLYKEGRKKYVWNSGDSLWYLLCLVEAVNELFQPPQPNRASKADLSGVKFHDPLPGK
jgi:hypothetical protein